MKHDRRAYKVFGARKIYWSKCRICSWRSDNNIWYSRPAAARTAAQSHCEKEHGTLTLDPAVIREQKKQEVINRARRRRAHALNIPY